MLKTGEMLKICVPLSVPIMKIGQVLPYTPKKNTTKIGISAYAYQKRAPNCSENAFFFTSLFFKGITVKIFNSDKWPFFYPNTDGKWVCVNKARPNGEVSAIYIYIYICAVVSLSGPSLAF